MHFIQDMWQSFRWRFAMQERLFVVWDTPQEAGLVSPAAVLQCFDLDRTAGDVGFHSAEVVFRFEGAFDMGNAAAGGGPRAQFGGGARCRVSFATRSRVLLTVAFILEHVASRPNSLQATATRGTAAKAFYAEGREWRSHGWSWRGKSRIWVSALATSRLASIPGAEGKCALESLRAHVGFGAPMKYLTGRTKKGTRHSDEAGLSDFGQAVENRPKCSWYKKRFGYSPPPSMPRMGKSVMSCDRDVLHRHRTLTVIGDRGRCEAGLEEASRLGKYFGITLTGGCTLDCSGSATNAASQLGSLRALQIHVAMAWLQRRCCAVDHAGVVQIGAAGATFRPVTFGVNDTGSIRGHGAFVERDRDSVRALEMRRRDIARIHPQDELSRQRTQYLGGYRRWKCVVGSVGVQRSSTTGIRDASRANRGIGCTHWRSQHVRCVVLWVPSNHGRGGCAKVREGARRCAKVQQRGRRRPYTKRRGMKAHDVESSGKATWATAAAAAAARSKQPCVRRYREKFFLAGEAEIAERSYRNTRAPIVLLRCGSSLVADVCAGHPSASKRAVGQRNSGTLTSRLGREHSRLVPLPRRRRGVGGELETSRASKRRGERWPTCRVLWAFVDVVVVGGRASELASSTVPRRGRIEAAGATDSSQDTPAGCIDERARCLTLDLHKQWSARSCYLGERWAEERTHARYTKR
ncbi:hypothetical protein PMIN01_00270 [Paraphaeosphaeria minitans]|uniref:Uncharacterized protein n=1 Tax=Paraphaeosphaeria minitans TaxID=565426 RepID=A0A9P6GSU4_9PLEO|nr:hypothetical protein PMIN01_00270 [Paraphaeosphaeria minitans]